MKTLLACMAVILAPLNSEAVAQDAQPAAPADLAGNWMGTLDVGGAQLRLRFVVTEGREGLSVAVFSLDQGNAQIPNAGIAVSGDTINVSMAVVGASFEGTLSTEDGTITGNFTQAGNSFPLVLERVSEEGTEMRRPQDPVEPYPYLAEEVTYPNPEGGHTMAGTFTRPAEGGSFPAVILISGSGPQNRDEQLMGHRPFLVLADHLTRRGIAVLRYDDRGVGESTGDFSAATHPTSAQEKGRSLDFASDALAAVAYQSVDKAPRAPRAARRRAGKARRGANSSAIGLRSNAERSLVATQCIL